MITAKWKYLATVTTKAIFENSDKSVARIRSLSPGQ